MEIQPVKYNSIIIPLQDSSNISNQNQNQERFLKRNNELHRSKVPSIINEVPSEIFDDSQILLDDSADNLLHQQTCFA